MPKINIDELCEPIEVTVGGKTYHVDDIPKETAEKMQKAGLEGEQGSIETLVDVMTEVLGADRADIDKLGMRKLLLLVTHVMNTINDEVAGKNVPKAAPKK